MLPVGYLSDQRIEKILNRVPYKIWFMFLPQPIQLRIFKNLIFREHCLNEDRVRKMFDLVNKGKASGLNN